MTESRTGCGWQQISAIFDSLRQAGYLLCTVLLCLTAGLQAQEQNINPGINSHYEHPVWQQWVSAFENQGRELYARRHAIADAAAIRPGMAVADIGAGTGLFTRLFAPRVEPGGRVYAVDISDSFVENILRTCREQGIANVEGIVNTPRDAGLPPDSIDLAFLANTYHHFEYPVSMLASIHGALRRDGRLIIVDFRRQPGRSSQWVLQHVRAGRDSVIREIRAAGFQLVADRPLLESNYFLEFRKATE